jgi:hypothetical protein
VARSIHVDATANIIFAGEHTGTFSLGAMTAIAQATDLFVGKVGPAWDAKWLRSFPVTYQAVAYDPSGGVVLAGPFSKLVNFGCPTLLDAPDDLYLVKLDSNGTCAWAKGFSAPGAHVSLAVDPTTEQIALAGDVTGPLDFHTTDAGPLLVNGPGGGRDIFTVTFDKDGNIVTPPVAYGGPDDDTINAVTFDAMGAVVIAGAFKSNKFPLGGGGNDLKNLAPGKDEAFAARLLGGAATWQLGFPGATSSQVKGVAVVGGVPIVAGQFTGTLDLGVNMMLTSTGDDLFVLGISPNGASTKVQWSTSFVGMGTKTLSGFTSNGTDAIAVTGSLNGDIKFGAQDLTAMGSVYFAKLAASDGHAIVSRAIGSGDASLTLDGVAFEGATLYLAGGFAADLFLNSGTTLENSTPMANPKSTDLFVATACFLP